MTTPTISAVEAEILTLQPTEHRLLVRMRAPESKTKGGIIVPATALANDKKVCAEGTIIAAGPGYRSTREPGRFYPMDARIVPGAQIVFALYKGQDLRHPDYRMLDADDVLAIIPQS
jgi:chaperonin GroES